MNTPNTNGKPSLVRRTVISVCEVIELLALTVVTVLLLTLFLFRHAMVDGPSMQKTLEDGEHLLVSGVFFSPQPGDIVVFDDLSVNDHSPGQSSALVKRVIAVEGQHLLIIPDARDGEVYDGQIRRAGVYVDGEKVDESAYLYYDGADPHSEVIDMVIPEGKLFVMGDHRNKSLDSRDFGLIDRRAVLGRVLIRLAPFTFFSR
ncbi:MAG: signal peptidase I [Clostridia bacterium]|nr:signal peptidase I [Clostridia bacterium]